MRPNEHPVVQAIYALCEHPETYNPNCPKCASRADAIAEHIKRAIQTTLDSLDNKDAS